MAALPTLAEVSALEVRLGVEEGTLDGPNLARAEAALGDASALIRSEAGRPWVDADGVTITAPDAVLTVCIQAAKRAYLNPEDLNSENVGDYGSSRQAVGVYLTEEERRVVRKALGGTYEVRTPSSYFDPLVGWTDPGLFLWGLE